MASQADVRNYLAYWFQLGKRVVAERSHQMYAPSSVLRGDRFSSEFDQCWQDILARGGEGYYLEGTDETIAELLSPTWSVAECARCNMPVPMPEIHTQLSPCPCNDIPDWPNEEIPQPRLPVNSNQKLLALKNRLESNLSPEP